VPEVSVPGLSGVHVVTPHSKACLSFQVHKCLHHDLYLIDRELALHVRIQGGIPIDIQVYVNAREWLARALDKAGIGYVRFDNSLQAIDDLEAAAELCERFALGFLGRKLRPSAPGRCPRCASGASP
jgi:hypothetical protein